MATDTAYVIRAPRPEDVEALGALHCRVWQEAYAGLMSDEAFAALTPERFTTGWRRRTQEAGPDGRHPNGEHVAVAEFDGALVGFISVGPARDEDPPTDTQLWAINVVSDHYGSGVAQQLLTEILGESPAYLWVADGNDRAIRFYERNNFRVDGARSIDRDDGLVEVRMVRG